MAPTNDQWTEQSFDDACRRVRPALSRWVRRRVRNDDHCEEVLQKVFFALAKNRASFRPESMDAYALRAAANAIKNYYQRDLPKWTSRISLEDWAERFEVQRQGGEPCLDQGIGHGDFAMELFGEMKACCSPVECSVVKLFYEGLGLDEVARSINMNPVTVRSHFKRAREKLFQHLWMHAPDLLGGQDRVLAALRKMESDGGLSAQEATAVREHTGGAALIRGALLKVAPFLGAVFVAFFGLGGRS